MKQLSNAFIQALNDDEREYLAYATIELMNGTTLNLTNEEIWSGGFSYEESVSEDNSFTAIGSAIMGSATLIINNIYDDYTNYDFSNARVSLSMGMTGTEDVLPIGEYKVDDTSYNGATIQLTLLDNMAEFDRPYSLSTLAYPTNLGRIVYDACLNCGVSAAYSAITFPNNGYIISFKPSDENVTFRDVIAWAATLAGCFAKINAVGELEFRWFDVNSLNAIDTTSPTFHPWETEDLYSSSGVHYLYSLTSQNICTDDVIITGVTVRVKTEADEEVEENILSFSYDSSGYVPGELENDGSSYIILVENNQFILSAANARTVVEFLGPQLVGLRFRKLNITQISDPSIESGDVAIVTDRKLNNYKTLITRNVFSIGTSQTIVCGADTPSRSNASSNSDVTKSYIEARKLFKKSMSATDDALNSAIIAAQAAHEAQESADSALASARSANNSANSALTQLSIVEDVAGTLRWISENGTFNVTTDTTVQPGTVYFVLENGEYVPITNPDTSKNPHEEGWYILDVTDSQASFIMAHLAVTDAGLWILPVDQMVSHQLVDSNDNDLIDSNNNLLVDYSKDEENIHQASGYKVLISGETTDNHPVGVSIYNSSGDLIANYGATTTIGNTLLRNVYIDTDAVYIRDGETVLASYGLTTKFYEPDGVTEAAEIGANGMHVKQGQIGRFVIDQYGNFMTADGKLMLDDDGLQLSNNPYQAHYRPYYWTLHGNNRTIGASVYSNSSVNLYVANDAGTRKVEIYDNAIEMYADEDASQQSIITLRNNEEAVSLLLSTAGNRGLYDNNVSRWLIYKAVNTGNINILADNELYLYHDYANGEGCYVSNNNNFRLIGNSTGNLGSNTKPWDAVYAIDTTIHGSDRKLKDNIEDITFSEDLIRNLKPVTYMWKNGDHRRKRMGFIAQDVAEVCKDLDENLYLVRASYKSENGEDEPSKEYFGEDVNDELLIWNLSYEQLIAPMVCEIQKLMKRVDELEAKVKEMEEIIHA